MGDAPRSTCRILVVHEPRYVRFCLLPNCGKVFYARRADQETCGATCRQRAHRAGFSAEELLLLRSIGATDVVKCDTAGSAKISNQQSAIRNSPPDTRHPTPDTRLKTKRPRRGAVPAGRGLTASRGCVTDPRLGGMVPPRSGSARPGPRPRKALRSRPENSKGRGGGLRRQIGPKPFRGTDAGK